MRIENLFIVWSALMLTMSCGTSESTTEDSALEDVSFPGQPLEPNTVLWIQDQSVFKADCAQMNLPVRVNCGTNAVNRPLNDVRLGVERRIDSELSTLENSRIAEVRRLKDANPEVVQLRNHLLGLTDRKGKFEKTLQDTAQLLASLDRTHSEVDTLIQQYRSQIAAVTAALAKTPDDAKLLMLRGELQTELEEAHRRFLSVGQQREATEISRVKTVDYLTEIQSLIADKQREFDALYQVVHVGSTSLNAILRDLGIKQRIRADLPGLIELMRNPEISYRANLLSPEEREAMNYFVEFFTPPRSTTTRIGAEGILEVYYQNEWRGVCDDNFGPQAGKVACASMGRAYVSHRSGVDSRSSDFWLDDVVCQGTEPDLFACQHYPVGTENCGNNEHIALVCQ